MQPAQKFVEEVDAAVVRQTRMIAGDFDISGRIWRFTNS